MGQLNYGEAWFTMAAVMQCIEPSAVPLLGMPGGFDPQAYAVAGLPGHGIICPLKLYHLLAKHVISCQ